MSESAIAPRDTRIIPFAAMRVSISSNGWWCWCGRRNDHYIQGAFESIRIDHKLPFSGLWTINSVTLPARYPKKTGYFRQFSRSHISSPLPKPAAINFFPSPEKDSCSTFSEVVRSLLKISFFVRHSQNLIFPDASPLTKYLPWGWKATAVISSWWSSKRTLILHSDEDHTITDRSAEPEAR